MRDTGRAFLLSVAWFVTATTPVNAQEVRGLWTPVNWRGKLYLPPQAVSHAVYEVDLKLFASAATQRIRLPLPKNREIDLWLEAPASAGERGLVRQGKVDGDEHSIATFAVVGEALVGDVLTSGGKMYRLDHVAPRTVVIMELAPSKFPPGGKAVAAPVKSNLDRRSFAPRMRRTGSMRWCSTPRRHALRQATAWINAPRRGETQLRPRSTRL